ncbi:MAG TPA: prenyltransferase/squalene oxidase repeat-containing protein [Planctomycetota bacterium]|jgi:hypothetical protein
MAGEAQVLDAQEVELAQEPGESQAFLYSATSQTPWWMVSLLLHGLIIALAALVTIDMNLDRDDPMTVTVTDFVPRNFDKNETPDTKPKDKTFSELASKQEIPPTDPTAKENSNVLVPEEMLQKAELGDHFETVNPDRPDTHSAFGTEDSHIFYSSYGSDDKAGGGGTGGLTLDDELIGAGGSGSKGTGGGWGGGDGTGIGLDKGSGVGSFGTRSGGGRRLMVKRHRGSPETENCVEASLRWLAYHQEPDGRWDSKKYGSQSKSDTACTGFALLAFLGAGHTEKIGAYRANVQKAVAWMKSKQDADGMIWDTSDDNAHHRARGYPAAIATLALAEAAGMANLPDTRAAAQKAIDYCTEKHQCGEGSDKSGWRYAPKQAPDTSVTGWFTMALKSAKVANLHVNPAAFDGAIRYLDSVEKKEADGNGYGAASHYAYTQTEDPKDRSHRLSAIGNLARQFLGWKKEDLQSSVEWFVNKGGVPEWGANGEKVDLYYWYYGTLCVFQQDGDLWKRWNDGMKKALTENQCRQGDDAGSWNPVGTYSTEWGRVGQTALACLCLEVYYRYAQLH